MYDYLVLLGLRGITDISVNNPIFTNDSWFSRNRNSQLTRRNNQNKDEV
jgi:hypothetical protein